MIRETDDPLIYFIDDKEYCDESAILIYLLERDVLFCNSRQYICPFDKSIRPETIVLFVICNDVFAWGCADSEEITCDELPVLYKAVKADPKNAVVKWACKKRNLQPQRPIVTRMKADGSWDDEMEALPKNGE